jgi:SAM-dependent methyltransferase
VSRQDKDRWDEKWSAAGGPYRPHSLLTRNSVYMTGGVALDLACGRGQNALWLAGQGYQVLAVDISPVAIHLAHSEAEAQGLSDRVRFQVVDLDEWIIPPAFFDLIAVFRFLNRRLFGPIRDALRPGGLVYYSTRHVGILARNPAANEAYLLQPGELPGAFPGWHILHDEEGPEDAQLIARKPKTDCDYPPP